VTVGLRRVQADKHHARPIRPAVRPIVAITPARAERHGKERRGGMWRALAWQSKLPYAS
jgi:hypothetical protein